MEYIFASDPHGTGKEWIDLVQRAQRDYPQAQLVFGGDYIDGRKNSRETLEFVMAAEKQGAQVLLGNHEDMMINFVEYDDDLWFVNGAKTTVKSLFGRRYSQAETRQKLKASDYYCWIKNHAHNLVYETKHLIFVHAGVNPAGIPVNRQYKLWAREEYWYGDDRHNSAAEIFAHNQTGKTIVTGHSPTCIIRGVLEDPTPEGQPEIFGYTNHSYYCPVVRVQYLDEAPRYFTDGGCHSDLPHNHGNVCVFSSDGKLTRSYR